MPYTPPAGNAADFNFANSYVSTGGKPPGNSIIFNFGGVIGFISSDINLPIAKRQAQIEDDNWAFMGPKRFAPPADASVPAYIPQRFFTPLYQQVMDEPEQFMFRRSPITFIPTPLRKRAVLFVVT